MNELKFTVYENGKQFPCHQMSGNELESIEDEVVALLPEPKGDYWFEVDTFPHIWDGDEDPDYAIVICYQRNPDPQRGKKIRRSLPEELKALEGKTFRVEPRQFGGNNWAERVEIVFESPPSKGTKASDLIQRALQQQKAN